MIFRGLNQDKQSNSVCSQKWIKIYPGLLSFQSDKSIIAVLSISDFHIQLYSHRINIIHTEFKEPLSDILSLVPKIWMCWHLFSHWEKWLILFLTAPPPPPQISFLFNNKQPIWYFKMNFKICVSWLIQVDSNHLVFSINPYASSNVGRILKAKEGTCSC